MKKIMIAAVVLLTLTGCGESSSEDIKEVAAAKEQCHELGGVFTVRQGTESRVYYWECDLSDYPDKD